jgi:phosphate transport system substrate-binding protein
MSAAMNNCRSTLRGAGLILALALAVAALLVADQSAPLSIAETGSHLLYPLFTAWVNAWVAAYPKADPGLRITTAAAGSSAGIAQTISKQVQIGASDSYMSDKEAMANPHILNIPIAISAQTVVVNLPELRGQTLKLSGPVLAGIYSGKVRDWGAEPIAELNRGVSLPHHVIIPIRRAGASGETFVFTQFLSFSAPIWEDRIGWGTNVNWPQVSGGFTASGDHDMLQAIARTPYALGYLGVSFTADADKAGLIIAMLKNQDGNFVFPTAASMTAAAAALTPRTPPDERLTLAFAPGPDSYPLINYEYALVSEQQPNPKVASAISDFLLWCISPQGGSASRFLDPVHFMALPPSIRASSEMQIAKIQ